MISSILHIGLTVSNLEQSVKFYRDVLGLKFQGQLTMQGPESDTLFDRPKSNAKIAYLSATEGNLTSPPLELIEFTDTAVQKEKSQIFRTGVSEICFQTDNIEREYERLKLAGVKFLSSPRTFDFSSDGYGRSKAVYFYDPDGIILELLENLPN